MGVTRYSQTAHGAIVVIDCGCPDHGRMSMWAQHSEAWRQEREGEMTAATAKRDGRTQRLRRTARKQAAAPRKDDVT